MTSTAQGLEVSVCLTNEILLLPGLEQIFEKAHCINLFYYCKGAYSYFPQKVGKSAHVPDPTWDNETTNNIGSG